MTSSVRERIILAVLAAVAPTAGLGGKIWRSRQEPFSRGAFPALVVEPSLDQPEPKRAGFQTMPAALDLRFLLLIDAPIPDAAADPILVNLHSRLMVDVTLAGLATSIEPGPTTWGMESDGVAAVETHYVVRYKTRIKDLAIA